MPYAIDGALALSTPGSGQVSLLNQALDAMFAAKALLAPDNGALVLVDIPADRARIEDEAEFMLRQSIPDPANHIAVLRSIAQGHNRNSQIADRTGLSAAHITKILTSLERLGLAATLRPITASPRAKKTAYAITDQFLRFNYRFVEPAKSQLRTNALAATYLDNSVIPVLDHHASTTWEEICRQYVLRESPGATAVGRWWGQVRMGGGPRTEERKIE